MKTTLLFLFLFIIGCDSSTEPSPAPLAGDGSTFVFATHEFDADGFETDTSSKAFSIDSVNIALDGYADVIRMASSADTLHLVRDGNTSLLIYRPDIELFNGITLPKRWQAVATSTDTGITLIATRTGETSFNGQEAQVTIHDREQYNGTSTLTVQGTSIEVITKSFSVEVIVHLPGLGITSSTTVTDIYGYAPTLGILATIKQVRTTDSEFSPIIPGRTEHTLSSYIIP